MTVNSIKNRIIGIVLLASCLGALFLFLDVNALDAQSAQAQVRVLQSDTSRIVIELTVDGYTAPGQTIGGARYVVPTIPGLISTGEPGKPQLPMKGVLVAIPPGAQASLRIIGNDTQNSALAALPLPVPTQLSTNDPNVAVQQFAGKVYRTDAATYAANQFYPRDSARINSDSAWRSQRVLSIGLYPLQVNPVTRQAIFYRRLRVEITLTYPRGRNVQTLGGSVNEGAFEQVFQESILNYSTSKTWRAPASSASAPRRAAAPPPVASPLYRVLLNRDGMYQITCAQFASAGIPLPLDMTKVQLFKSGTELAIFSTGSCANSGDTGYIEFFGQAVDTKYTATNVYWLTYGATTGKRMTTRDGSIAGTTPTVFTDTLRVEQNRLYRPNTPMYPIAGEDRWYWETLSGGSKNFTFQLGRLSPIGASAVITTRMTGYTAGPFSLQTSVNGNLIENVAWSSAAPRISAITFARTFLASGVNTVTVASDLPMAFNNFDLAYPATFTAITDTLRFRQADAGTFRYSIANFTNGTTIEAFDITDPFNVARFNNLTVVPGATNTLQFGDTISAAHNYLALATTQRLSPLSVTPYTSANLQTTNQGADYIVISYAGFQSAVQPLVDWRAAQGLRVKSVDAQNVYDEFNDGVLDPQAIYDFLQYAFNSWTQLPKPQYVLLVGDGHWDPREYCLNAANCPGSLATPPNSTFIPPNLYSVDPFSGETTADDRLVMFGAPPKLPDMALGRLPANSTGEVTAMVNKILGNEQNPATGDWRWHVSLVAGDSYHADGTPDPAGDFWALSDVLIAGFPNMSAQRIYFNPCSPSLNPACNRPYSTYPTASDVHSAIQSAINNGRLLVNYIGHSAFTYWTSKDPTQTPHFFEASATQDDISTLTNTGKYPVMLEMTCFTGYYQIPYLPGLAEVNVRRASAGALASWSPTGQGLATGHDFLDHGFLNAVYNQGERAVGEATLVGKSELLASGGNYDLLDTFVLLGDPASRLQLAFPPSIYLPFIQRNP